MHMSQKFSSMSNDDSVSMNHGWVVALANSENPVVRHHKLTNTLAFSTLLHKNEQNQDGDPHYPIKK